MTAPDIRIDPKGWWSNQIDLHPPKNEEVAHRMDFIRKEFKHLGLHIIALTPAGPDQTLALRALKEASMYAIGCIACNQGDL